jgi:mannose-6-phosphate isomerase-like protein (cupin superfamily)
MMKYEKTRVENPQGGCGYLEKEPVLAPGATLGDVSMYAKITLGPKSTLGYHIHEGNSETYYVLEGEALYNDNGEKRKIGPGDITFTPSGSSHGIENSSDTPFVFMALIVEE